MSVELVKARRGCWIPQSWSYRGRTELGSSARVALTLNSWPLFPTPRCVFICISLMTGDGEHFFLCLLVICTPSPAGCLLISLSHSFTGLSDCLLLSLSLKRMLSPSPPYPLFHEQESWGLGLCGVTVSPFHLIKFIPQPQSRFTQGRHLY